MRVMLSTIIGLCSLNVLGYTTGNSMLSSIIESWVSIKPITSLSIICLCVALIMRSTSKDTGMILFNALFSLGLMLISAVLYVSSYATEALTSKEVYTIVDGCPSWGTIICISILDITLIRSVFQEVKVRLSVRLVSCMCVLAMVGYMVNEPLMYFYVNYVSTGMSIITAVYLFAISVTMNKLMT